MSCEFGHWDGAYVLGSLSAAERSEYQAHLAGCDECTLAVQELAGLPGLLARVPAEVLESPAEVPLPETLLPALLQESRGVQRRRTRMSLALAAAAAVVVAGGSLAIGLALGDDPPPAASPAAPTGRPMESVGFEWMTANLALTSVSWGTKLDLTCSYPSPPAGVNHPEEWAYVMVVRTRDGRTEQVATWRALPGKTMRLAAATATDVADISSVEIRTSSGEPVLRLEA